MKSGIHPEIMKTTVTCLGCSNSFETTSTVDKIAVDVCSQCHPFYTGKQKLVDTAGRVDRFRARTEAAKSKKDTLGKKAAKNSARIAAKIAKKEAKTDKNAKKQDTAKNQDSKQ